MESTLFEKHVEYLVGANYFICFGHDYDSRHSNTMGMVAGDYEFDEIKFKEMLGGR